jgi:hypothetical protein
MAATTIDRGHSVHCAASRHHAEAADREERCSADVAGEATRPSVRATRASSVGRAAFIGREESGLIIEVDGGDGLAGRTGKHPVRHRGGEMALKLLAICK